MNQFTAMEFGNGNKAEASRFRRYSFKAANQYLRLSDELKTKLAYRATNVFRISRLNNSLTEATSNFQSPRVEDRVQQQIFSKQQMANQLLTALPKIQDKQQYKGERKLKSSNPPKVTKISSISEEQQLRIGKSAHTRYSMAPHLNLQRTVYLFKRQSLDSDYEKYLFKQNRLQKSFQFDKNIHKKSNDSSNRTQLHQDELLTGLRTTFFSKPAKLDTSKREKDKSELEKKLRQLQNLRQQENINRQQIMRKERCKEGGNQFTPWHIS